MRLALLVSAAVAAVSFGGCGHAPAPPAPDQALAARFVQLALAFAPNEGQIDGRARFIARGSGATVFVGDDFVVLGGRHGALRIRPAGANPSAPPVARGRLAGRANYLLGADPARWRSGLPTFSEVVIPGIYPGVDWVCHGAGARFEYDFVIAPGADPSCLAVEFDGATSLALDGRGDLVVTTRTGAVVQRRPVCHQATPDGRREVDGRYVIESGSRVAFELGAYDRSRTLVVDPVVDYGTYLGGASGRDTIRALARDSGGNLFVAGDTNASDFPTAAAFDASYNGAGGYAEGDGFVAKLDATGTAVLFSTFVGGTSDDGFYSVAIDPDGNVVAAGQTNSGDYPTTPGALARNLNGAIDACLSKLSPDGSALLASTYFGSGSNDYVDDLEIDGTGAIFATGELGPGIATTPGAVQPASAGSTDAYLAKLTGDLAGLTFVTYLGGSGGDRGIAIELAPGGDVLLAGYASSVDFPLSNASQSGYGGGIVDGFVARFNPTGTALVFSTYLGGTGTDVATTLLVGTAGEVVVAGNTSSPGLGTLGALQPDNAGGEDAFVARYSAAGALAAFTYLGGTGDDFAASMVRDGSGRTWIAGTTSSGDFPVLHAEQPRNKGGADAFVARMDAAAGALEYASYAGGTGDDDVIGLILSDGDVPYVAGSTTSDDLASSASAPQREYAGAGDGFLATPHPDTVDSFFLPRKIAVKSNPDPSKTKLTAQGYLDTGSQPVDLTAAAQLTIGSLVVDIPALAASPDGKTFTYVSGGLSFRVVKNPFGSSRAKFYLARTGDLAGAVSSSGPVPLRLRNGLFDAGCTVQLTNGGFRIFRTRGSLVAPNLFIVRASAALVGPGKDSLNLFVGLATAGATPDQASDVTVTFGSALQANIPAAAFQRKGDQYVFKGDVNGVTSVVLDYAKEVVSISGRGMDLGAFAEGPNPLTIVVGVGTDVRGVSVTASRIKKALKY